jgi:hypothetical protein
VNVAAEAATHKARNTFHKTKGATQNAKVTPKRKSRESKSRGKPKVTG